MSTSIGFGAEASGGDGVTSDRVEAEVDSDWINGVMRLCELEKSASSRSDEALESRQDESPRR